MVDAIVSPPVTSISAAPLRTSIGRKLVVAITGILLLGFLVAHLAGNLQIFLGRDAINGYGVKLHSLGPLLWILRVGLIVTALAHVVLTVQIAAENRVARPVRYRQGGRVQTTLPARSMTLTGLMVLAFVLFHLAHFTWRLTHPEYSRLLDPEGRLDVYSMMVLGFQQRPIAATYMLAMLLLGLHLIHGLNSIWQTFGFNHPRWNGLLLAAGPLLGTLITGGYMAIPAAVLAGIIRLPPGVNP